MNTHTDMSERERMEQFRKLSQFREDRMSYLRKARRDLGYVAPELMPERLDWLNTLLIQAREANRQAVRLWWRRDHEPMLIKIIEQAQREGRVPAIEPPIPQDIGEGVSERDRMNYEFGQWSALCELSIVAEWMDYERRERL